MIPRLPGIVIALGTVLSANTQAQTKSAVGGCYRFDRAYFGWVGRPPGGGNVVIDSARLIRLDSTSHPRPHGTWPPVDARVVRVPSMLVGPSTTSEWLNMSFWRVTPPDGVELQWRNGLYGPVFRLVVAGDSLRGQVRFTTDVVGAEPPPARAVAVRVPCPR